jgi:hypothetical protein
LNSQNVLFIVNEVAHYYEFKKLLLDSKISSVINGILLFDRDGYDPNQLLKHEISDAKKNGFNFLVSNLNSIEKKSTFFTKNISRIIYICRVTPLKRLPLASTFTNFLDFLLQIASNVSFYVTKQSYLKNIFEKYHIQTIILGEENILLDTFLFKTAFTSQNVFIYPYTIPNPKEMAGGAYRHYGLHSNTGVLLRLLGGRWVRIFDNNVYLLLPISKIFSFWIFGYNPKNPWVLNFDLANKVLLESEHMAKLYKSLGFSSAQIEITGSLNDDIIARTLSFKTQKITELKIKYKLPADKPCILIGFPPDQFPREQAELLTYNELIEIFITALKPYLDSFSVLISKHPRITNSLSRLTDNGFIICDEPTIELIPLAHIYIASASATIRWAIASGIPVLNYDLYRYQYSDYSGVKSVIHAASYIEFTQYLHQILANKNYFDELRSTLQTDAKQWGVVDGKSAERILKIISH